MAGIDVPPGSPTMSAWGLSDYMITGAMDRASTWILCANYVHLPAEALDPSMVFVKEVIEPSS